MDKKTIELFLQRNPIDDDFMSLVNKNLYIVYIPDGPKKINFTVDLESIKSIGLDCSHVFIETDFGRYSFLKKIKGDE